MVTPLSNRPEKDKVDKAALYGCLGTVLAAVISGLFLLASTSALQLDLGLVRFGKTPTPDTSATVFSTPTSPAATQDTGGSATVAPTSAPQDTSTNVLGQPWEQDDLSLTLTRIEIHTSSGDGSAAASASFRLLNKSGQEIVVPVDWTKIHLEDSLGNKYVDWEGGQTTTSFTIDPQESHDFQRYYGLAPRDRSRIPVSSQYVDVVVDQLSRIKDARWRYLINADLVPIATPDPASVKTLGGTWQQAGWELTVTRADIYSEQEGSPGAAHIYFTLANKTGTARIVQLDFNHIYLLDSFGQRYSDWQGGQLDSRSIDSGDTWTFDRYYSIMSQTRSRIPSTADFILITVDGAASLANKQWRIDIAH